MKVLKSEKLVSVKLPIDGSYRFEWFTFKKDDVVPEGCVELVEKKGGVIGDAKVTGVLEEPEREVVEQPKKRGRKKKEKTDDKSVVQKGAEIVKGVVDDLADDGILNNSND